MPKKQRKQVKRIERLQKPKLKESIISQESNSASTQSGSQPSTPTLPKLGHSIKSEEDFLTSSKEKFCLTWKNVTLRLKKRWIDAENSRKEILHNICGYAQSGEMVAIIGPSGSGKTSLMNVIGKRYNTHHSQYDVSGTVKANNVLMTQRMFKNLGCFIE